MKEVLEKLVFSCPRCGNVKRNYSDIFNHLQKCDGQEANPDIPFPLENQSSTPVGPGTLMPVKTQQVFGSSGLPGAPTNDLLVYIMEKDTKKFFIYNAKNQSVTSNTV